MRTLLVLALVSLAAVAASGCLGANVSRQSSSVTCIQDDCEVCVGDDGDCAPCEEAACEECRDGDCAAFDAARRSPDVPAAASADFQEQGAKELSLSMGTWSLELDVAEGAKSSHASIRLEGYQGLGAEQGQHCFEYTFEGPSGSSAWMGGTCGGVGNVNVAVSVVPGRDIGLIDESDLAVGHHTFKVTWQPRQANTLVWDIAVDY